MSGNPSDQLRRLQMALQNRGGGGGFPGGGRGGMGLPGAVLLVFVGGWALSNSMFNVDGGHRAIKYSRVSGVKKEIYSEGTHLRIPWLETPVIYDVRAKPRNIASLTGTKDLQMVNITCRVLSRPRVDALPQIYRTLGQDFDERVLPSIVNEVLKSVVAQFNASQLITQRENVARLVRENLARRAARFNIALDDVSLTHLTFSPEFTTPLSISSSSTLIDGKAPRQSAAASSQCVTLPTLPPPPVPSQHRPGKGTTYCRKIARNVIAMATGEAPAEVGTTEVPEIIKTVQEAWDKVEDKYAVSSLAAAGFVGLWVSTGMVSAIDKLPLVPGALEIVGIGYSGWFAYKNLIFKPDRDALIQKIKDTYKEIIGSS